MNLREELRATSIGHQIRVARARRYGVEGSILRFQMEAWQPHVGNNTCCLWS